MTQTGTRPFDIDMGRVTDKDSLYLSDAFPVALSKPFFALNCLDWSRLKVSA